MRRLNSAWCTRTAGCCLLLVAAMTDRAAAQARFCTGAEFAAGYFREGVALVDLDGDAIPDFVSAAWVRLGNGDGTFQPELPARTGGSSMRFATADLDGDTVLDFVATGRRSVEVRLGNGDGTFQTATSYWLGGLPQSVAVADLDGDTIPDLVTANGGGRPYGIGVLMGNGDGSFQDATYLGASDWPVAISLPDLDGDGVADIVAGGLDSTDVIVRMGRGDGSFQRFVPYPTGRWTSSLVTADLNGDDTPDVLAESMLSNDVSVLFGRGDGSLLPAVTSRTGPGAIALADVDGDDVVDLVVQSTRSLLDEDDEVSERIVETSVRAGNGDGAFGAALIVRTVIVPVGLSDDERIAAWHEFNAAQAVAIADLDGDDRPDLIGAKGDILTSFDLCPVARASLDIQPGRSGNVVRLRSRALIRVALLGSPTFDVLDIDPTTLAFGPAAAAPAHESGRLVDVNGDGFVDFVSHYTIPETGIALGDAQACLTGRLLHGAAFGGCDSIRPTAPLGRLRLQHSRAHERWASDPAGRAACRGPRCR
jgi:hypothetical protein